MPLDFAEIRRQVIVAMFADDRLMQRLVLKGGNALDLIHGIGARTSLDVDFSIDGDFEDLLDVERRLRRALTDRFDSAGYIVFDFSLRPKPSDPRTHPPKWGGYLIEFKLISKERYSAFGADTRRLSYQAEVVAPGHKRIVHVEVSKHEFCGPKASSELQGYTIYVYTPAMIAIEKLRAICQQMPEYPLIPRNAKRARARDFYDIHAILRAKGLDLGTPENVALVRNIFDAKDVPIGLIRRIPEYREFHRPDWPAVLTSTAGKLESYDWYFDAVVAATERLHPLWEK